MKPIHRPVPRAGLQLPEPQGSPAWPAFRPPELKVGSPRGGVPQERLALPVHAALGPQLSPQKALLIFMLLSAQMMSNYTDCPSPPTNPDLP